MPFRNDHRLECRLARRRLGSVTKDAVGANAGGGVSFNLGDSGAAVFAEVRYHYANTKPTSTAIVPVSVGIHWAARRAASSRP